ncbi:MAG: response regulator [Gammaproteobacteria bacterium]|jgi:FixJ family two-component response regulator|nr:response regulator [Gammaproteobacteria bacterium]
MPEIKPLTVYVVDDDAAVRDSLDLFLRAVGERVRTFESGDAFLDAYSPEWRGCILLDIQMPGTSGVDVQEKLIKMNCTMPIIFVTGNADVPMAVEAMHQGAFDFIQKPYRDDELMERISQAMEIHRQSQDEAEYCKDIQRRAATLTPREREVMQHVVSGAANKVVAMDLGLSQRTVEVHRSRVMEKMGARSLAELVRMSISASL